MAKKRKAAPSLPPVENHPEEDDEDEEEEYEEVEVEEEASEEEEEASEEEEDDNDNDNDNDDDDDGDGDGDDDDDDDEGGDESSKREALRKLLEPFTKSQLIDLVKESAQKDPSLLAEITRFADSDPAQRKIFVHGLARDVTSRQLLQAFEPFGEIEESRLITDKATGRAKGYAFVVFKTRAAARMALKDSQKTIGGRNVSCQLASVGPAGAASETTNRKIYVGNVGPNVSADNLRAYFAKFGEIEEGPLGFDSATNKSRGFAIFVYKSDQGCKNALEEPMKSFEGCNMYCKKFVENINNNKSGNAGNSNRNQPGQMGKGGDNYGVGVAPGIMNPNMNMGALLMAQNQGLGYGVNPMMASVMNQSGMVAPGLSTVGPNYGINSVSPNVIDSYSSQAALQGLGAYQNAQLGQSSSAGGTTAGATRTPSSGGPVGTTFPSYYGR